MLIFWNNPMYTENKPYYKSVISRCYKYNANNSEDS